MLSMSQVVSSAAKAHPKNKNNIQRLYKFCSTLTDSIALDPKPRRVTLPTMEGNKPRALRRSFLVDLALAASSVLVIPSTLAGAAMVAVLARSPAQWEGGKRGLLPIHKNPAGVSLRLLGFSLRIPRAPLNQPEMGYEQPH